MAEYVGKQLNDTLYALLQKERFVTLATVDHKTGAPYVSALSWIYAPQPSLIRFAVDQHSEIVQNIRTNKQVVFNVIGAGTSYSINGEAAVIQKNMENVPIKMTMIEVEVRHVRDVMFDGARMMKEPEYEKTYDAEAAAKLDQQVMEALKK